ncbi:hypothetical protein M1M41_gp027 [Halorubrum sodomense tailed virus 4]|uniref:Uncharacterized protein n=2 Tax=Haloferacalesvirus TaxID=2843389 RepID=A0AAE9BW17_9CAUD|nr:hypothetical protein M1M41_gp027 [Halorubrum sodomense tailed virus 4]UBF20304.1 hypothetical protein HSTV-4_gp97 [Halorubrum sodomense tailed virus 4]UBF21863.1 hypothetical protein HSTV-3_gp103 [Halorubrum virus HSTV-3]UBF21993.1 hypothetical protein HJTV-3_gp104 [Haloarcula virus HJTV-3]UBF22122.1 hypothetical protein HRTV-15_gp103 [Halorubrum virus HRTV-15]
MSTTTSTTDSTSTDEPTTEDVDYDDLEEQILDELPERFGELSHLRRGRMGDVQMILIPHQTWRDGEGELSSHLLMNTERNTLSDFGFEFKFATLTGKGVGVKFWFEAES